MWSDWSSCSGSCGERTIQHRSRVCVRDQECKGEDLRVQEKSCVSVNKCTG